MIELTRLNNVGFAVNSDLIEIIEATPDTVITMMNGHKYVVRETLSDVIAKICEFRRSYTLPEVSEQIC